LKFADGYDMVYPKEKDMKKLFLVMPLLAFLLVSCSFEPDATIINNSGYTVTFTVPNGTFTLGPTKSMDAKKHENLSVSNFTPKKVSYNISGTIGEFTNGPEIDLYVINLLNQNVELSAGGYIEDEPLSILISASGTTGKKIYTSSPVFTAVFTASGEDYPAAVNYIYAPASTPPKITVTIH
jgi:hypothetical protein